MPDIIQPFVVVSGLAVGVTATTVITDSATLPIAVSSFNGLTGAVIGVNSFNGLTGAVIGVNSFNGLTGAVIGVNSFNGLTGAVIGVNSVKGMTGTVILPGLDLYFYSIGII